MRMVAFTIIVFVCVVSCKNKTSFNGIFVDNRYNGRVVLDRISLKINAKSDSVIYRKTFRKDNCTSVIAKTRNDDAVLYVKDGQCQLINIRYFQVDSKTYKIFKYHFNIEGESDVEETLFFCDQYGVIVSNLLSLGFPHSSEYDKVSSELVKLILADTTNLYIEVPPPPVIPPKTE